VEAEVEVETAHAHCAAVGCVDVSPGVRIDLAVAVMRIIMI